MEYLNNGGASCMQHLLKYLIIFNKKGICVMCDELQLKKFLLNTATTIEEESSNKYDVFRGISDTHRFLTSNVIFILPWQLR